MGRVVVAEALVRGDVETVRRLAQSPAEHARWDVRFTRIEPTGPGRFRYATRLGLGLPIEGWGASVETPGRDGSALRFGSDDPRSLIAEGAGTWTYAQEGPRVRFRTTYDYRVRHGPLGRALDRVLFRPVMAWATRWSFDRLRLWVERGLAPEDALRLWLAKRACTVLLGLVWVLSGLVPKLLAVAPAEVDLVARSGLWLGSPALTLGALGAAEVAAGLWLLSGVAERWALALTTGGMLVLAGLVAALDGAALADPYGGLVKNLGLLGCAAAALLLSPLTPDAARARGRA